MGPLNDENKLQVDKKTTNCRVDFFENEYHKIIDKSLSNFCNELDNSISRQLKAYEISQNFKTKNLKKKQAKTNSKKLENVKVINNKIFRRKVF